MPDDLRKIFAKNLTALLKKNDITQLWIADKLGVSSSTVSDWCNGNKAPRMDKIQSLADLLNVPVSFLTSSAVSDEEITNRERLEAMHQDPRLGLMMDRLRRMPSKEVDMMLQLAGSILKETDR